MRCNVHSKPPPHRVRIPGSSALCLSFEINGSLRRNRRCPRPTQRSPGAQQCSKATNLDWTRVPHERPVRTGCAFTPHTISNVRLSFNTKASYRLRRLALSQIPQLIFFPQPTHQTSAQRRRDLGPRSAPVKLRPGQISAPGAGGGRRERKKQQLFLGGVNFPNTSWGGGESP